MPRYVAFLRGMNLGKRRLPMSRLKSLFEELKFDGVETFIASGNVIFSSRVKNGGRLESEISAHLEASLGYSVDGFVRTTDEVAAIGQLKIFPEDGREGIAVHVGFFHHELPATVARKFAALRTENDQFRVMGREYYWLCRVRIIESNVWKLPEARELRLPSSTMRNMTSIRKLIAKHID